MEIGEILTLVAMIILWAGALIGQFVWIKVKLKELSMLTDSNKTELEMMIEDNEENLEAHIYWGKDQQMRNEIRFKELINENKEEHKEMNAKMDTLLQGFNDLRVYIEVKDRNDKD
jgi:hypothetical protein